MTGDRMTLSGAWFGRYCYPAAGQRDVGFIATIEDVAGLLTGETSERVDVRGREIEGRAILRGSRSGEDVAFIKAYDGAGPFAHSVRYSGTLSEDGRRIGGTWQIEGMIGSFEMRREIVEEAEEEVTETAAPVEQALLLER